MIGFKLTPDQSNSIRDKEFAKGQLFNPVPDINGDDFIFINEVMYNENPEFSWVSDLPIATFIPSPTNTTI